MRDNKNDRDISLQEMTGQESGIVVYDGVSILCNWSSMPENSLPYSFLDMFLVPWPYEGRLHAVKKRRVEKLGKSIGFGEILDFSSDHPTLEEINEVGATIYELTNGTFVVAPDGWA